MRGKKLKEKKKNKKNIKNSEKTEQSIFSNLWKYLLPVVILLALIFFFGDSLIGGYIGANATKKTTACIENLKEISVNLDLYSNENNNLYPHSLNDLIKNKYAEVLPVCPASKGKEYIYKVSSDYKNYTLFCGGDGVHYSSFYKPENSDKSLDKFQYNLQTIPYDGHYPRYNRAEKVIYCGKFMLFKEDLESLAGILDTSKLEPLLERSYTENELREDLLAAGFNDKNIKIVLQKAYIGNIVTYPEEELHK